MLRLDGERICVRDWLAHDVEPYAAWQAPHHAWRRTDGPYYPPPSPEQIERTCARIQRAVGGEVPDVRVRLVIADRQTDRLIGTVSRYWQSEETRWLSVGLGIYDEGLWGRGLGYEALGLWCDYLLSAPLGLARLDLRTWSGNIGMMRLAEKLGFQREATFRKARVVDGQFYDGLGYGMLREEWAARYPAGFAASLKARKVKA